MKFSTLILFFFAAFAAQVNAQATLSIQGTVQNYDGSAVEDGEYDITFKLYTQDAGGTAIWTETQTVDVTGGIYSTQLGLVNPLNVGFTTVYYLGITLPGGPELIPRSRLTSAPYALSLIGQGNTFPSSGPIGAGTATPSASVELHVKDTEAEAKLLVESTAGNSTMEVLSSDGLPEVLVNSTKWGNFPRLTLRRGTTGSRSQLIQMTNPNGGGVLKLSTTAPYFDILFDSTNVTAMHVEQDGRIGFANPLFSTNGIFQVWVDGYERFKLNENTATFSVPVLFDAAPFVNAGGNFFRGLGGGTNMNYLIGANVFHYIAVEANGGIRTNTGFFVSSDSNSDDLASLLRLRVTDYSMKDEVTQGAGQHKGFIAQEVAQVLPAAVNMSKGVVPDIYALSQSTEVRGEEMTIAIKDKHNLKVGDKVKLITEKNNAGSIHEISRVDGDNSFSVSGWTAGPTDMVFVYGREVGDVHTVDYDYIHTVNVSATQELARRLFDLEKENDGLRSEVKNMNERLLKLETLVTGSAQR
jgi:hypothetical protein